MTEEREEKRVRMKAERLLIKRGGEGASRQIER